MLLAQINPDQAATIVAVLGAVASARGTQVPTHADRAVIEAAAAHLLGAPTVPEHHGPFDPRRGRRAARGTGRRASSR